MAVLEAQGLGLHVKRSGWVFRDLDIAVPAGEVVALVGPHGSGRTSALLALAGHFRHTHGSVSRGKVALGLVAGVHEPEPMLTAREHLDERLRLLRPVRLPTRRRRAAHRAELAALVASLPFPAEKLGRDLTPLQKHQLMLTVALIGDPDLVAIDDVDVRLSKAERSELFSLLRGKAALVTASPTADADEIVEL